MLRRLIDENIEMTIVPGKEIGCVKADSGYVGQVVMNLVVNARDAMPNGGKLTIATSNATLDQSYARTHPGAVAGDYVMLSVCDTGTGMTDEVKARMFEAFFTTKPKGRGTGLGLATCQTIVQQSAEARPSRSIFRESSSRWRSPPKRSRPGRCRAGRKPCWWWKMSHPSGIWRAEFWKPKVTKCSRPLMARRRCIRRGTIKDPRFGWWSPMSSCRGWAAKSWQSGSRQPIPI